MIMIWSVLINFNCRMHEKVWIYCMILQRRCLVFVSQKHGEDTSVWALTISLHLLSVTSDCHLGCLDDDTVVMSTMMMLVRLWMMMGDHKSLLSVCDV